MKQPAKESKIMSMTEAISKHVNDGDTLYLPWGNPGGPAAAVHELIRQGKKDLTVVAMALSGYVDPLFYGNQVKKIVTAWVRDRTGGVGLRYFAGRYKMPRSKLKTTQISTSG